MQQLRYVEANSNVLKGLGKLRQLRKLDIQLTDGNGKDLCSLIVNMKNLESLIVHSTSREEILDIQSLTFPPE